MHKTSPDPALMQELCLATDFALRPMKVTAQAFGPVMSTFVVREHYLWLNLAEMKDVKKGRFLDAPPSKGAFSVRPWRSFALQFSAVKKQTKEIKYHSVIQAPEQATKVPHPVCPPTRAYINCQGGLCNSPAISSSN